MTCEDFEKLIALDVAGDLAGREAAQVHEHVARCEACRALAAELAADLEWLRSAHREQPDRAALHQVRVGVMRRLEAEQNRRDRPFGGIAAFGWRWQWVVTAAAVVILAGSAVWWSRPADPRRETAAAHPPEARQQQRAAKPRTVPGPTAAPAAERPGSATTETNPRIAAGGPGVALRDPASAASSGAEPAQGSPAAIVPSRQLARRESIAEPSTEEPSTRERIDGDSRIEVVTPLLQEPQEQPSETVMLKMPSGNPDILVYWLMDDNEPPQEKQENEGD